MPLFSKLSPNELAVLATAFAILIATENSADDNNILGNFLTAVADSVLLIAAQQQNSNVIENKNFFHSKNT